jgi:uncharacterized DUF497 family protein
VDFADAALSLENHTVSDPDSTDEERFVALAADPQGSVLVTVYAYAGENRRVILSRHANPGERRRYEKS